MLTPAYKLTIGHKVVDTTDKPKASTLVDLTVALDLETPADSVALVFGNADGLKPARDHEAKVELGYADNGGLTQVITGTVITIEPGLTTTRVVGQTAAHALLRTFVEQTYESKTAGAMVKDLANQAGVEVDTADDGITFPAYVIDGRRSFYHHMWELADLCGFDLYINAEGKLVFEKFLGGKTVHVFEFAKHLLALEVQNTPARAGKVEAWGESPAGSKGNDAWAWLTKDFSGSQGTAGTDSPLLLLERPALRTPDAANTAAAASFTAIQRRRQRGRLLSLGRPEVKLGDAIRLSGMTDASLNASFQVRGVKHRLNKQGGFTTTIDFRAIQI